MPATHSAQLCLRNLNPKLVEALIVEALRSSANHPQYAAISTLREIILWMDSASKVLSQR